MTSLAGETLEPRQMFAADVIISEIMYHPLAATPRDEIRQEYIELYNKGNATANLNGWQFTAGVDFVFPNVSLAAGQYLVIAADPTAFSAKYPSVTNVIGGWYSVALESQPDADLKQKKLSDSGEKITLKDAAGATINSVTYADQGDQWAARTPGAIDENHYGWDWYSAADGFGRSMELINPAVSNAAGQNWAASTTVNGTPGSVNSVNAANIAPLISDLKQSPALPKSTDTVTITAKISDELASGYTASVKYRADGTATFLTATMFDDGLHGDGAAGDGVWGGTLPAQNNLTVVEFYVLATDAASNSREYPKAGLATQVSSSWHPSGYALPRAVYQVNNAYVNPDTWVPGTFPTGYIIMTAAEKAELDSIFTSSSLQGPNSRMAGTFISVDGTGAQVYYDVGIRNRGHGSRSGPPNNFDIGFSEVGWNDQSNLVLNKDTVASQIAGVAIFGMAGLVAAEAQAFTTFYNGSAQGSQPLRAAQEAVDGDFISNHFGDDDGGNLYTMQRDFGSADFSYLGTNPASYYPGYIKQTNAAQNDYSDIIELTKKLNNIDAGGAAQPATTGYLASISSVVNVEQWLRYLAVNMLLSNKESGLYTGVGDDYEAYRGVTDPRFVLIPHDLDSIMGIGGGGGASTTEDIFGPYLNMTAFNKFLTAPEVTPLYYKAIVDVINTAFNRTVLDPVLDRLLTGVTSAGTIASMKTWITNRTAGVLAQIPQSFTIGSSLTTVNGYPRTTTNTAILTGTASTLGTGSVLVAGEVASFNTRTGAWSTSSTGVTQTLLPAGASWKYLDNGTNQGTAWYGTGFNDSGWAAGNAELGYGDFDEVTTVGYGPNSGNRYITTYFRTTFNVADKNLVQGLNLQLLRDDGAVIYLNGQELMRDNMPAAPTVIGYQTPAINGISGTDESTFYSFPLDASKLVNGTNVIAVEIHQNTSGSSDISFNLKLDAQLSSGNGAATLKPGINRVLVQTFDGPNGTGNELTRGYYDVWYDDSSVVNVSGTLPAGTTTWTAAAGPYNVTADLTVPAGATLVIEPGTTVYFATGTRLIVNGTLTAVGNELQRIRFTRPPAAATTWGGIQFVNSNTNNQLSFFDQAYGDSLAQNILVSNSQVTINKGNWLNTTKQILNVSNSSFNLTNSTLPNVTNVEMVTISGVPVSGFALVQGNTFGTTTGKFDVIGITGGNRPNAIVQILDNTFNGTGDDILDFHGADGHVENNVFLNVANTAASDTNNAISAGVASGNTSEITSVRNYFYNVPHAYLAKEGSFITSTNNTVVGALTSVINFHEPSFAASPGLGATIDSDIYVTAPTLFQNLNASGTTTQLAVTRSMTPGASAYPGVGNSNADPRLTKTTSVTNPRVDFKLKPGSPAIGTGPNGVDRGAVISGGATITGEPAAQTSQSTATLIVSGAGITSYKYRLNGGAWSAETPIATPISLAGLANGSYTVQVAGRNSAGIWQADAAATTSKTWMVNSALSRLIINEVLANNTAAISNSGTFPDAIELYNAGGVSINLQGMRLSDTSATPGKYVFPAGFTLAPGQYLVLYADSASAAPGTHVGFSLNTGGEGVYLYNSVANGGALIDSVVFGQQIPNLSIGRVGQDQHWALTSPTFGSENVEVQTGDASLVKLNEWLASGSIRREEDFLELYNADTLPVAIGGFYLTDSLAAVPTLHQIAPLSFLAASGFAAFFADSSASTGPDHLDFSLSGNQEILALLDTNLNVIDKEIYFAQTSEYSQGPSPDGGITYAFYKLPTPGLANSNSTNVQGLAVIDNLRITEIMYNPLGSANTEYIELRNNGGSTIDLTGVRITSGIDFTFPAMNLAAGAYVMVVADIAAFQSRYGTSLNIAGQFTGGLSNSGEELLLELPNPFDIGVLRFDYSDAWYPTTDGSGYALAINSATALASTWGDRASWKASGIIGGSPGLLDPATTAGLTGRVTRDLNGNGIQDVGDPAISGMTVSVYSAGANGQIGGGDDVLLRTGVSDSTGDYSFFGLTAGTYYLQFTPLGGYGFTLRDQGADDTVDSDVDPVTGRTNVFTLAASQYDTSRDVGLTLTAASVVDRKLFYNNSSFDGNNPAAGASDDAAIASDKSALLPGGTATFANYSSYSRGINGVMVDIQGLTGTPVASDFIFRVGNNSSPSGWALAPAPQSITVRAGAGSSGSSRIELIWADGAIKGQWLQVTVKTGANTGLLQNDVFFFGNAVGEAGSTPGSARVNSTDEIEARNNPRSFLNKAAVTFAYDFNRDGFVNATDQILARSNSTTLATSLQLIAPPLELVAAVASPSDSPAVSAASADIAPAAELWFGNRLSPAPAAGSSAADPGLTEASSPLTSVGYVGAALAVDTTAAAGAGVPAAAAIALQAVAEESDLDANLAVDAVDDLDEDLLDLLVGGCVGGR